MKGTVCSLALLGVSAYHTSVRLEPAWLVLETPLMQGELEVPITSGTKYATRFDP